MSVSQTVRQSVRERAYFKCEFCGISETDSGGELTTDHFQPQSKDGSDQADNLVYCCFRCNTFKSDYWGDEPGKTPLFNPRNDSYDEHFWLSDSGRLLALTDVGEFSIKLLRLNRQPLVTKRQIVHQQIEEELILGQSQKAIELLIILSQQQRELLKEQQNLLETQRRLLELLFRE